MDSLEEQINVYQDIAHYVRDLRVARHLGLTPDYRSYSYALFTISKQLSRTSIVELLDDYRREFLRLQTEVRADYDAIPNIELEEDAGYLTCINELPRDLASRADYAMKQWTSNSSIRVITIDRLMPN